MALFSFPTLLIFFGWLAYGLFHSLLASTWLKDFVANHFPSVNRKYRLFFVLSAILTPLPLLYFHFTSASDNIWTNYREIRLAGGIMAGLGLAIFKKAFALYDTKLFLGLSSAPIESEDFKKDGLLNKMRHPLYTATLMIFWGWFLFSNTYLNLAFCLANTIYILVGIKWEEQKLIKLYGEKYLQYMANTPMLIPKFRKAKP